MIVIDMVPRRRGDLGRADHRTVVVIAFLSADEDVIGQLYHLVIRLAVQLQAIVQVTSRAEVL